MIKFIEMNRAIKDKIEHLYNIKGEDFYLIRQAVKNLKNLLITDMEEFNYIRLAADKIKLNELIPIIMTLPIINQYRLVVLDNPNAEVIKYLNGLDLIDSGVVVACVNADKLNGEVIDCNALEKSDIAKYVLNLCAKNKQSIQESALDYLIEACNKDMSRITTEVNKILSYAIGSEVLTLDIVMNLVTNSQEYAIFMLTSAIDNKDYANYQKIINEMSKSLSMSELYSYMGKYFKRMQYISLSKQDEELSKLLNIKPYAIKMSRQAIAKNGIKYYLSLYEKYIELDYQIKSGKITAQNAIYSLVF